MQTQDYADLIKFSKDFDIAKSKAMAMLNKDSYTPKPQQQHNSDYIPFTTADNTLLLDIGTLTALNTHLPQINPFRATANTYKNYPLNTLNATVVDDEILNVLPARPIEGQICVIDWLNVTMSDTSFDDSDTLIMTSASLRQTRLIRNVSKLLQDILGFGIETQCNAGMHFYDKSYRLEHNAGFVSIGGQSDTILISLSGKGCTYAKHGWQLDLHAFLMMYAKNPKITRIDLAVDDFNGSLLSFKYFLSQYDIGGFNNGGRNPNIELQGNWRNPIGKGRTMFVGNRKSPVCFRLYEKGMQLGDPNSPWLRAELEFKAKGILIPLDILLNPSPFFVKAYPCFHIFDNHDFGEQKLERIEREKLISFDKAIDITRNQFGRYLYAFLTEFKQHGLTADDLLKVLTTDINKKYPERIDMLSIPEFFKPKLN
ncbi:MULTISPECIES: replication initiation factor domain-containing protein [unclassified Moraxella]|uniref:replication initiation factor domain-containing protein n=1 Tax=unclassified Moraxella TaxID=2685852 RepID=UPI003AF800A7